MANFIRYNRESLQKNPKRYSTNIRKGANKITVSPKLTIAQHVIANWIDRTFEEGSLSVADINQSDTTIIITDSSGTSMTIGTDLMGHFFDIQTNEFYHHPNIIPIQYIKQLTKYDNYSQGAALEKILTLLLPTENIKAIPVRDTPYVRLVDYKQNSLLVTVDENDRLFDIAAHQEIAPTSSPTQQIDDIIYYHDFSKEKESTSTTAL